MPLYTWEHKSGEIVEVLRDLKEYDVRPTLEEVPLLSNNPEDWKRVIGTGIQKRLSNAFGFGKGYHNSQAPGRGRQ